MTFKVTVFTIFTTTPEQTIPNYRNYTDEDICRKAQEVHSLAGLLRALGLAPRGGNYDNMRRKLQTLNISTDHWTGQAWNKNQQLKDWKNYVRSSNVKKHLIKLRNHKCESCQLTNWQGQSIMLELDHIDGDRLNNNLENLRLLCPNCHSQTPTWRNRKR